MFQSTICRCHFKIKVKYLHAEVVLEEVDASGVVLARFRVAEANVLLAPIARPSGDAVALVTANQIAAGGTVHARVAQTFVDLDGAIVTDVTIATFALSPVVQVQTPQGSSRVARAIGAIVNGDFARQSSKAGAAVAKEGSVRV